MLELLDHCSEEVATQIHDIFQRSYKVEAELLRVKEFPPLQRNTSHIQAARSKFFGSRIGTDLAAVIEYSLSAAHLTIDSLVVDPRYFRRGLASKVLRSLLDRVDWQTADVETAAANRPAIALYEKFGFSESDRWMTKEGIDKIGLSFSYPG